MGYDRLSHPRGSEEAEVSLIEVMRGRQLRSLRPKRNWQGRAKAPRQRRTGTTSLAGHCRSSRVAWGGQGVSKADVSTSRAEWGVQGEAAAVSTERSADSINGSGSIMLRKK